MNKSIFKFSLDIHKPESQVLLNIKRLDASRDLHISLTENGRPYQITPDCSAVFTARKPDGNPIYNDCRIEGNVIIYDVTQQTVSCVGETDCEIRLFNNEGGLITSPRFSILVDYTIYNGEEIVESAPEFDALQQRIEKSDKLYDKVNNAYENGEFKGEKGEKGEKGDKGDTGEKGDKGDKGEDGVFSDELADEIALNTAARHTHNNKKTLDRLYAEMLEEQAPMIGVDLRSRNLKFDNQELRFVKDGHVIREVVETEEYIIIRFELSGVGLSDTLEDLVIPIGITDREMTEYVTAAINGSLDEIEAMIDESGVLDE